MTFEMSDWLNDIPTENDDELQLATAIANIGGASFDDLPSSVLARIASHLLNQPLNQVEEVRACHCLNTQLKRFPFRAGNTNFYLDPRTLSDVRKDTHPCKLDSSRGLFSGSWCLKQYVAHSPGRKRSVPNFAAVNKMLYKKWRDAVAYVFCGERCLAKAVSMLPEGNLRMMTRVRFYERSNKKDTLEESREAYETGLTGEKALLVYGTRNMQLVEYRGRQAYVKELTLDGLNV